MDTVERAIINFQLKREETARALEALFRELQKHLVEAEAAGVQGEPLDSMHQTVEQLKVAVDEFKLDSQMNAEKRQ